MAEIIIYLVLAVFYLALLSGYLTISPLIAALRALGLVGELLRLYGRLLVGVLHRRTPEFEVLPPYRPQDESTKAYRNYFFGPAVRDLRQLLTLGQRMYGRCVGDSFRGTVRENLTAPSRSRLVTVPWGLTLCVGLAVGAVLAVPPLFLLWLLQAVGVGVLTGAARLTAGALRAVDRVLLRAKQLHTGMLCPHCFERVPYPSYDCPRDTCRRRHEDIRPGTYGIFRRRCECGGRMPTLLMLMSRDGRLQAYCTHESCGKAMNADAGHAPELVIPLIGGRAAGKTQLMAAMLMSLENAAGDGGPAVRLADDVSLSNYQVLREVLRIGGHTRGTQRALPRAHSFVLGTGRAERLVHVFDTAGERFVNRDDVDALRYVRAARTFVFVLDPLAVDSFWTRLEPSPGPLVDRTLASPVSPEVVFGQSAQTVATMGTPLQHCRLAVAISKTDLLTEHGLVPDRLDDSAAARAWLREKLGLHNLVQAMELEFGEVRFFCTAAVTTSDDHQLHDSIAPFVGWCLNP
ncbi:hypothetical protein LHJ74_17050 [Streptomyces sp. N2-109]|uniref:Double-GTPase 2 domain-containing protein n=1 Tax=Streptomyces gossypii TaxID=2883101 RepID=A0ABT2JUM4_9ACTN|nr:hypothetical protein [Streptomyces gossypii]MCT2591585.1 hypothetical protein [Streptomyces gossypii]